MAQVQTRILIDGNETYELCPRAMTAKLLTYPANLQLWSLDGLREFLSGTCEVVRNWCTARLEESPPDDLRGKYKRYGAWATRVVKNFPKQAEYAPAYIYNVAMAAEGNGLLSGFGIADSHGGFIRGNPEKTTLRRSENENIF